MKNNLSNNKRKELKKKSYSLKPIIMIGQKGLTDSVISEIDSALTTHELIKIRARGSDKDERTEQCLKIEQQLNANVIHKIGFITVLYRPAPTTEK
tara:strand:+ start:1071 stop:1358 length:288 start_codon:yes stop_codon:yes gene_type:complete